MMVLLVRALAYTMEKSVQFRCGCVETSGLHQAEKGTGVHREGCDTLVGLFLNDSHVSMVDSSWEVSGGCREEKQPVV